jgi:acyl-coenzyme A thioesterase PaaI-like protein
VSNFFMHAGLKFEKPDERILVVLEPEQEHSRFDEVVSGGLLAHMLDAVAGATAFRAAGRKMVATRTLDITFLREAKVDGGKLVAEAKVSDGADMGPRFLHLESEVLQGEKVVARARTLYVRYNPYL